MSLARSRWRTEDLESIARVLCRTVAALTALVVVLGARGGIDAGERRYEFEGKISRDVLENYLARSITFAALLHGKGNVDDNIRMLRNVGARIR